MNNDKRFKRNAVGATVTAATRWGVGRTALYLKLECGHLHFIRGVSLRVVARFRKDGTLPHHGRKTAICDECRMQAWRRFAAPLDAAREERRAAEEAFRKAHDAAQRARGNVATVAIEDPRDHSRIESAIKAYREAQDNEAGASGILTAARTKEEAAREAHSATTFNALTVEQVNELLSGSKEA